MHWAPGDTRTSWREWLEQDIVAVELDRLWRILDGLWRKTLFSKIRKQKTWKGFKIYMSKTPQEFYEYEGLRIFLHCLKPVPHWSSLSPYCKSHRIYSFLSLWCMPRWWTSDCSWQSLIRAQVLYRAFGFAPLFRYTPAGVSTATHASQYMDSHFSLILLCLNVCPGVSSPVEHSIQKGYYHSLPPPPSAYSEAPLIWHAPKHWLVGLGCIRTLD